MNYLGQEPPGRNNWDYLKQPQGEATTPNEFIRQHWFSKKEQQYLCFVKFLYIAKGLELPLRLDELVPANLTVHNQMMAVKW